MLFTLIDFAKSAPLMFDKYVALTATICFAVNSTITQTISELHQHCEIYFQGEHFYGVVGTSVTYCYITLKC